jgi:ankyrin repeat protein
LEQEKNQAVQRAFHTIDTNTISLLCFAGRRLSKAAAALIVGLWVGLQEGVTALMFACMADNYDAARLLLQAGTEVNAANNEVRPRPSLNPPPLNEG